MRLRTKSNTQTPQPQAHGKRQGMTTPHGHLYTSFQKSQETRESFFNANIQNLVDVSQLLAHTIGAGHKILICGNGGSAADAQHMAAELVGRMLMERRALPAIALTTDSSNLTAIGNDYGYDVVFSRQVEALGQTGDLLIAISTSGNSANVVKAVEAAWNQGLKIVALTGGTGGKLAEMHRDGKVDILLNVEKGTNSSQIQETHIFIVHALVDTMDRFFAHLWNNVRE